MSEIIRKSVTRSRDLSRQSTSTRRKTTRSTISGSVDGSIISSLTPNLNPIEHTTRPWPLPQHRVVALVGTVMDMASFVVGIVSLYLTKWFRNYSGREFGLQDKDIACGIISRHLPEYEGFICYTITISHGRVHITWQELVAWVMYISLWINGFAIFIMVFFFWIQAFFNNVFRSILRIVIWASLIGSYLKLAAGMLTMSFMSAANTSYLLFERRPWYKREESLVHVLPLPLGLIFTSAFLEILTLVAMKIATDIGVKGELTHNERLGCGVHRVYQNLDVDAKRIARPFKYRHKHNSEPLTEICVHSDGLNNSLQDQQDSWSPTSLTHNVTSSIASLLNVVTSTVSIDIFPSWDRSTPSTLK